MLAFVLGGDVVRVREAVPTGDSGPQSAGRALLPPGLRLFLLSFLMLFVELALIRWLGALVLYGIVRVTLLSDSLRARWARVATPLAGSIAAIWLVHPIQTESVSYTIQRGESLMGLFYLLTLY